MSKKILPQIVCPRCEELFTPSTKYVKHCFSCSRYIGGEKRNKRVTTICQTCGVNFESHSYRVAKFCSKECWEKRGNTKKEFTCLNCASVFTTYKKDGKFCSNNCCHKYRVGVNAPAFKDGKSLERDRARLANEVKEWRFAVFQRDNFTCQHCGKKKDIHAHHIKEWAKYPELRFDVSNGLTLCAVCHGKVHGVDFTKRRRKTCKNCNKPIKNKNNTGLCLSCGVKSSYQRRKEKSPLIQLSLF